MEAKLWYKSRTLWIAVITAIIGVLSYVLAQVEAGIGLTVGGVLMALLRVITSQEVKFTK